MAPFRPTNLNKRYYPGNASVIGPTCTPTLGITTTQCCTCVSTLCGTATITSFTLGCRCHSATCPCCQCCNCCSCTVCARTTPSGMWKSFEQYTACSQQTWGCFSTCSTGPQIGFCANNGIISGGTVDCQGFLICDQGSGNTKWWVPQQTAECSMSWYSRGDANSCASNVMGIGGWFVPSTGNIDNPGRACRTYWNNGGNIYWTNQEWSNPQYGSVTAPYFRMANGQFFTDGAGRKGAGYSVRSFRTTTE